MTATIRVRHLVGGQVADLSPETWAAYQKTPLKDVYEVLEGNEECLTCGTPEEDEPTVAPAPVPRFRRAKDEHETNATEENAE